MVYGEYVPILIFLVLIRFALIGLEDLIIKLFTLVFRAATWVFYRNAEDPDEGAREVTDKLLGKSEEEVAEHSTDEDDLTDARNTNTPVELLNRDSGVESTTSVSKPYKKIKPVSVRPTSFPGKFGVNIKE